MKRLSAAANASVAARASCNRSECRRARATPQQAASRRRRMDNRQRAGEKPHDTRTPFPG
ncbi:putative thiamine-phosphate pyrophosphorylase [Burkholderia thailandensis]|uniref:Thiamine-phosphate pyrophosphorylase n=1 Tax=Burkholderia thailandensis TaxID=57975 RepID=A0AAW9D6K1_BURTH|nr:putative thiamine-phosphate pyrophosphorylase [Burkholderia thailandensis]